MSNKKFSRHTTVNSIPAFEISPCNVCQIKKKLLLHVCLVFVLVENWDSLWWPLKQCNPELLISRFLFKSILHFLSCQCFLTNHVIQTYLNIFFNCQTYLLYWFIRLTAYFGYQTCISRGSPYALLFIIQNEFITKYYTTLSEK